MIVYAIPGFLLLIAIELFLQWRQKKEYYDFADAVTSINIGLGMQVVAAFERIFVIWIYTIIYNNNRFFSLPNNAVTFILALLGFDFIFYWAHRWAHVNNFWWASHVVHHQSEHYNLSTALRQPWFHNLTAFFLFLPMPFLGFSPLIFLPAAGINTLYQFWIHTQTIGKLGPFEWIFNTPSHHRVHHGVNPKYLDRNFGGMFIIWDRIFGTFQKEEEPVHFGITSRFDSYNPVWANFQHWVHLFKMAFSLKGFKSRIALFFRKPAWKPGISKEELMHPDVHPENWKRRISPMQKKMVPYVVAQFFLNIVGLAAFLFYSPTLSWFYKITFAVLLVLSILVCGALLEAKARWHFAEYFRLVFVFIAFVSCYWFWYPDWFLVMGFSSGIVLTGFLVWFSLTLSKKVNSNISLSN